MSSSSQIGLPAGTTRIAALLRGLCPRCRDGKVFRGVVAMNRRCPQCCLHFEREPGYFLGAMYFSYGFAVVIVTVMFWLVSLLLPRASFETVLVAAAILFLPFVPVVFRYSRIVWLHFDHAIDPP